MQRYLAVIILLQLIICLYLGIVISKKKSNVLGDISINTLQKEYYELSLQSPIRSFYEPKQGVSYEEVNNGYAAEYSINKDRLNETADYPVEKDNTVYRILTLGDSFTFGVLVDTQENWTEKLEVMLNSWLRCESKKEFEVINLGVGGYDIEYALERYKIRGAKYNPDLVIWLIKGDDLWQVNKVIRPIAHRYTLENTQEGGSEAYRPWLLATQEFKKNTDLNDLIVMHKKHISDFRSLYKNKIVFGFMENTSNDADDRIIRTMLKGMSDSSPSISYFEFPDIHQNKDWIIQGNGHPTEDGHTMMAESIFRYLTEDTSLCN